ncbi:hypothetical protein MJO52_12795 [Microbulbifer variabilis]|uniref:Uncharacterized protein n=1 Tax=Microbulbifer variabilis TaxID=266805 RepID=A0ABY4V978_9GAMM|nr:hypothetical protein [Microbulbifer variabilis]USD19956.1 hypothetical protein MJO52_12795 [Microbulbifer variabilis]
MLPDNQLSSQAVPTAFIGGAALPVRHIIDYERGGIAIQDTSRGLDYQTWRVRILNDGKAIVLDAQQVAASTVISGTNITEVSLAFDQNMRPVIAYVESGTAKLYWYDSSQAQQVTTSWPGIITPRVSLDEKRPLQQQASDVIFAYLKNGNLYHRRQRDRYGSEYLLASNVNSPGLVKIGMSRNFRLQFLLKSPD